MSVFDDPTTGQENSTTEQENQTPTTEDFLSEVVKEKGDHWSDPQTLAKGYYHAQQRIKELTELVEANKGNDYAKQLLEQLKSQQAPSTQGETTEENTSSSQEAPTPPQQDDLQSLIDKALTERERRNTVEQNLTQANSKLEEMYGTEARTQVETRAKELGMSMQRLQEIAGESPTAFLRLMGEPSAPQSNNLPNATVNTAAGISQGPGGARNFKYYQDLRRSNQRLYNDPQTQRKMFEDAKRMGAKFYQ